MTTVDFQNIEEEEEFDISKYQSPWGDINVTKDAFIISRREIARVNVKFLLYHDMKEIERMNHVYGLADFLIEHREELLKLPVNLVKINNPEWAIVFKKFKEKRKRIGSMSSIDDHSVPSLFQTSIKPD